MKKMVIPCVVFLSILPLLFILFFVNTHSSNEVAKRGCCSWHGGVCGCVDGRVLCCDGTLSPSCTCIEEGPDKSSIIKSVLLAQRKTYVRPYYRKDGTYVRGHYRSLPGNRSVKNNTVGGIGKSSSPNFRGLSSSKYTNGSSEDLTPFIISEQDVDLEELEKCIAK